MNALAMNVCTAVEKHVGFRARRRAAAPAMIALGEAIAVLGLCLPVHCPEQDAIDGVMRAIEKAVANTPAGRRWVRA